MSISVAFTVQQKQLHLFLRHLQELVPFGGCGGAVTAKNLCPFHPRPGTILYSSPLFSPVPFLRSCLDPVDSARLLLAEGLTAVTPNGWTWRETFLLASCTSLKQYNP